MIGSLRVGLIGAGRLAEAGYLPAARLSDRVRIAALADPDVERRAVLAGEAVATHPSAEAMLDAGGIDAVVVASPPETHEHLARLAASAGVPALVEKPPAPDLAGARRIAGLHPRPFVGFNRRFSLGMGLENAVPRSGSIELEIRYRRFSWSPVMVRDPALLDLAPHLADLALRSGIGAPTGVAARSPRPERVEIDLEGTNATARITCATDRFHRERATVLGPDGAVVRRRRIGGPLAGALERLRPGPHPLVASLAAQLDEFAAACGGEMPSRLATAADGVKAMTVVAAAAESLALGGEAVRPEAHGVKA